MKVKVLSYPINEETPLYGGNDKVKIKSYKSISCGDSCNSVKLSFPNHTGTHFDAPYHFIANGRKLTDYRDEEWFFDKVAMVEVPVLEGELIQEVFFKGIPFVHEVEFLIIKTGFEKFRKDKTYIKKGPVFTASLAKYLIKMFPRLKAIGFDMISLSSLLNREEGRKAHRVLLGHDVRILEDMKLNSLFEVPDRLLVSPLLLDEGDGAPVTTWAFFDSFDWEKYDYFFFDFDGVILDSNEIKSQAFYEMYLPYGEEIARKVRKYHEKHGGMSRFRKFVHWHQNYLGEALEESDLKKLTDEFSDRVMEKVLKTPFIPGVERFLSALKKQNKKSFVVTGTPDDEIKLIVKKRKLEKYFEDVLGSPTPKDKIVSKLLDQNKIKMKKSVLFGDSITDFHAAVQNQIKFIGINGYESNDCFPNFDYIIK